VVADSAINNAWTLALFLRGKLNLTQVIWRLSSLEFFSSPYTPSSPTPASNSGDVRVWVRVSGCWGPLLTTGLRRRAGGDRPARAAEAGGWGGSGRGQRLREAAAGGACAVAGAGAPELRRSPSAPV